MTLIGYTDTYYKVRASYGSGWGESGYVRYQRGASQLTDCNFYKNAYYIRVDYNRGNRSFSRCSPSSVSLVYLLAWVLFQRWSMNFVAI